MITAAQRWWLNRGIQPLAPQQQSRYTVSRSAGDFGPLTREPRTMPALKRAMPDRTTRCASLNLLLMLIFLAPAFYLTGGARHYH